MHVLEKPFLIIATAGGDLHNNICLAFQVDEVLRLVL